MAFEDILVTVEEPIGFIILNRPERSQCAAHAAPERTLDGAGRVGARRARCGDRRHRQRRKGLRRGGRHRRAQRAWHSAGAGTQQSRSGQRLTRKIERLRKPVIMAVNGFALGGGCELAMAGDIRIASENAKFGQPEVNLGLIPGYGGTQRLTRLAGKGIAMHLCLTGETIDANEALRIGLVTRVVPAAELMNEAKRIATLIAAKAPLAMAACKRAINNGAHLSLDDALELEALEFGSLVDTEDIKEGTAAFLEKRKPAWKGR